MLLHHRFLGVRVQQVKYFLVVKLNVLDLDADFGLAFGLNAFLFDLGEKFAYGPRYYSFIG